MPLWRYKTGDRGIVKTGLCDCGLTGSRITALKGTGSYLLKIGPLALMNIILISFLFTTSRATELSISSLMNQYIYFIPLYALSAGLGTWETELFESISEMYTLEPGLVISSKLIQVGAELLVPCGFFIFLLSLGDGHWKDFITLFLMAGTFSITGIGLGVFAGFRTEKSINNMLNLFVWVLGFGPGPFFGPSVRRYQFLFPGYYAVQGDYFAEWALITCYATLGLLFARLARRPRQFKNYSK